MIWTPEPLLAGETVFLLAGGPSLMLETADRLRGRRVMVINSSYRLAPWADFLFFMDLPWFQRRREIVEAWPGMAITTSVDAKLAMPRLRLVPLDGASSGHSAIQLAFAMCAARIVLLGYDMRKINGRSHHHDEYDTEDPQMFVTFLRYFAGWSALYPNVINCTPGSALTEFPTAALDDVL